MLRAGERPPEEFTRPEVADILIEAERRQADASVSASACTPWSAWRFPWLVSPL